MRRLPTGKIDPDILAGFLLTYTRKDDRVVIGAGIGEDATVIKMGKTYLVAKTDPITHATRELGHYAVNINANDIAAMGGKPLWFLATVLMPEGSTVEEIKEVFSQISKSCRELGIVYCGGHTEVTSGVNNPVVIGQMLGEVTMERLKPSSGAQLGDDLIMTKCAAIEATSIIAREKEKELAAHLPEELILRAKDYVHDPGISVLKEADLVAPFQEVHALHDPTEGGIATGIFEMATASDIGVEVYHDHIPLTEETRSLCRFYAVDPLGTFASGSLLIASAPSVSGKVISTLAGEGITATRIGVMVAKEKGMNIIRGNLVSPLPIFPQDELSKIFG